MSPPPTLGLILAGGRAKRLGGVDKALVTLAGRPLLAHAIARAASQCAALLLSANGNPARFAGYGLPVVADAGPAGGGPLEGVLAGLGWREWRRPDLRWLATFPVDCPFLPTDLVARLHAGIGTAPVAIVGAGGRSHPAIGLWSPELQPALAAALQEGQRRVEAFVRRHDGVVVDIPCDASAAFLNVNTQADLELAAGRAARG